MDSVSKFLQFIYVCKDLKYTLISNVNHDLHGYDQTKKVNPPYFVRTFFIKHTCAPSN